MVRRRIENLTERFVGPNKVKKIVLSNTVELELPSIIKIHLVVNVSKIVKNGSMEGTKEQSNRIKVLSRME